MRATFLSFIPYLVKLYTKQNHLKKNKAWRSGFCLLFVLYIFRDVSLVYNRWTTNELMTGKKEKKIEEITRKTFAVFFPFYLLSFYFRDVHYSLIDGRQINWWQAKNRGNNMYNVREKWVINEGPLPPLFIPCVFINL